MTEATKQRVLIYDISNVEFPEFKDQSVALGQAIILRQKAATTRLIDTVFKQVFGVDMNEERNDRCNFFKQGDSTVFTYQGRPFLKTGDIIEEDPVMDVPTKAYLEYEVIS